MRNTCFLTVLLLFGLSTSALAQIDLYLIKKPRIDSLKKGLTRLPFEYDEIFLVPNDSIFIVKVNGKHLYDKIGTNANPGFDENTVEIIFDQGPRYYNIQKNGKPYFNDRYVGLSWTDGNIVVYGDKGKVGMLTLKGDTLVPFQYAKIDAGNFLVKTNEDLQGLADSKGRFLVPIAKQHIKKWQPAKESAYTVRRSGQRYQDLMDRSGKVIEADCTVNIIGSGQMHLRNIEHQWDFMRVGFDQTNKYG